VASTPLTHRKGLWQCLTSPFAILAAYLLLLQPPRGGGASSPAPLLLASTDWSTVTSSWSPWIERSRQRVASSIVALTASVPLLGPLLNKTTEGPPSSYLPPSIVDPPTGEGLGDFELLSYEGLFIILFVVDLLIRSYIDDDLGVDEHRRYHHRRHHDRYGVIYKEDDDNGGVVGSDQREKKRLIQQGGAEPFPLDILPLVLDDPSCSGGIQSLNGGPLLYEDLDGDIAHDFFLLAGDEGRLKRVDKSLLKVVGGGMKWWYQHQ